MKKILLLVLTITSISAVHANILGKYSLVSSTKESSNKSLCSSELEIIKSAPDTLEIEGSSDLGTYYNIDSAEGVLIVAGINKGDQRDNSTNQSHGEKYVTTNNAILNGDNFKLTSTSKTKFVLTLSKTVNTLEMSKNNKTLSLKLKRSFVDSFGSNNWSAEEVCKYTEE
ncbi:MAG: hypothetical protein PHY93_16485 [Bacteriovorax sp.]|nr:hypothetical protein [Bacteriovorax sp.]